MIQSVTYSVGDALRLDLEFDQIRFGLKPDDLFQLALRQNRQRAFLFVSKILGKHLPIRPASLLAAGKLLCLALEGNEEKSGHWLNVLRGLEKPQFSALVGELESEQISLGPENRTLFVGFAETATGLARAVADCYGGECLYVSTTRFDFSDRKAITFQEAHSHAKTQRLYLEEDNPFVRRCQRAVIVDDEFTTGNTALQLIEALHQQFGIARFVLLSPLDWSDGVNRQALEERLSIQIQTISLLHGRIRNVEISSALAKAVEPEDWRERDGPCAAASVFSSGAALNMGRLPLTPAQLSENRAWCREAARSIGPVNRDTLILGTGELIYEPALIAGYCGGRAFHSTTQSPIYLTPDSAIEMGARFLPLDNYSTKGYLYQVPPQQYRRAIIFAEAQSIMTDGLGQLAGWLHSRGCNQVEVITL